MRITLIKQTGQERGLRIAIHEPLKGKTGKNEIAAPFGIDANPYPGIKGAFMKATTAGRGLILAFINKFLLAQPGEIRIYSTDPLGNAVSASMHFKNDGTYVIEGNGTINGDLEINGNVNMTGDMDIEGDINLTNGNIEITNGDLISGGIPFLSHIHYVGVLPTTPPTLP